MPVADLFKGADPAVRQQFAEQMKARMTEAGLPYGSRNMTYNSRLAQELAAWADTQENGAALHKLLYQAYFVDNQNIGDRDVLITLAATAGLDIDTATEVLDHRLMSPQVNDNWQRAWNSGVTGVPTFWCQDLYVMGCQPYETLLKFVNHLRKLRAEAGHS